MNRFDIDQMWYSESFFHKYDSEYESKIFLHYTPKGLMLWKQREPKLKYLSELTEPFRQLSSLGFQSEVIHKSLPLLNQRCKAYLNLVNGTIKINKKTIKGQPSSKIERRYFKRNAKGKIWKTVYEKELKIPPNEEFRVLVPKSSSTPLDPSNSSGPYSFYQISKIGKKIKMKIRRPLPSEKPKEFSHFRKENEINVSKEVGKVRG